MKIRGISGDHILQKYFLYSSLLPSQLFCINIQRTPCIKRPTKINGNLLSFGFGNWQVAFIDRPSLPFANSPHSVQLSSPLLKIQRGTVCDSIATRIAIATE